jgi:hypothetical protein
MKRDFFIKFLKFVPARAAWRYKRHLDKKTPRWMLCLDHVVSHVLNVVKDAALVYTFPVIFHTLFYEKTLSHFNNDGSLNIIR